MSVKTLIKRVMHLTGARNRRHLSEILEVSESCVSLVYSRNSGVSSDFILRIYDHTFLTIEEIRAELVSLKLELYDTSKEAKNNIKAYRKRKKNQLITGETDAVDKLISFTSKKIDRAQDNLDVIRLLQ